MDNKIPLFAKYGRLALIKTEVEGMLWKVNKFIQKRIENFGAQYLAFGIFGIFNFPIYYIIWSHLVPQSYTNFTLRLIATLLCIGLVIHKKFPTTLKKYLPLYWYFTLWFCLPFFFTFMLFKNAGGTLWLMNNALIIFFLLLLVDYLSFLILLLSGIFVGFLAYMLIANWTLPYAPNFPLLGVVITYVVSIIIGAIFAHNKQRFEQNKINATKAISATIAHEMRTPLASLSLQNAVLAKYFETLLKSYELATEAGIAVPKIRKNKIPLLRKSLQSMKTEIAAGGLFIDMLLMNVKSQKYLQELSNYSMIETLEEAITRYPFLGQQRQYLKLQYTHDNDFMYYGNQLMMVHVFFNLLKNALFYLAKKDVPEQEKVISIKILNKTKNYVIFRDSGIGIEKEALRKVFTKFYSGTTYGVGIGLSFCQATMESMKGKISVHSKPGQYTEFVLEFPKAKLT